MNEAHLASPVYDRTTEDIGNVVELGHVNVRVPDQKLATLFYVTGLGLTRDPYLVVGVDNMWVNVGRCQFHLPTGQAQVLRGTTGLVVPDLPRLLDRLQRVKPRLEGTRFDFRPGDGMVEVSCPWGNRIRVHAPDAERFGPITLGIPYVEIDAATGSTERIARFYREMLGAPATFGDDHGRYARIPVGLGENIVYRETERTLPSFDGHHIQIALADFSGPHRRLDARRLVTEESSQHQYRFQDVVDLDTGEVLATVEHEVRSMRHPMYARPLVNRDPEQTNNRYAPGREIWPWAMPAT